MIETVLSVTDLDTYLKNAEINTTETPYEILLSGFTINDFGRSEASDLSIPSIIFFNKKYVKLTFDETTTTNLQQNTDLSKLFRTYITTEKANELSLDNTMPENPYIVSLDTSIFANATNADEAFNGCSGLKEIDTNNFSNVESAMKMFYYCKSLKTIDTSSFSKVTQATAMFAYTGLESIDTIGFLSLVENTTWMFQNCTNLKILNARGFVKVKNWYQVVQNCTNLKEITNFICPLDTTQTNFDFETGTNTVYKIPYKNTLRKNLTPTLVRISINTNENNAIQLKKQSIKDTIAITKSLNLVDSKNTYLLQTNGMLDEVAKDSLIFDEQFNEMIKYKVQWMRGDPPAVTLG